MKSSEEVRDTEISEQYEEEVLQKFGNMKNT